MNDCSSARAGLMPGVLAIQIAEAGRHLEPLAGDGLVERDGRPVVAASGLELSDADARSLRDADQR